MSKFELRDHTKKEENSWEKDNHILTEKIQKDVGCLINPEDLETGLTVFSMRKGYTKIIAFEKDGNLSYPITVYGGDSFTKDGKNVHTDKFPTLFKSNPFEYLHNKIKILETEKFQLKEENDKLWERLRSQGPGV